MKKLLPYICFFFLLSLNVQAQQVPMYSQYIWNAFLVNPAIGGAENFLEIKAGYRTQWVNLDGAPRTLFLTGSTQIGKKIINREDIDVINRKGSKAQGGKFAKIMGYTPRDYPGAFTGYRVKPHHGVGAQIVGDQIGPFSTLGFYGSYAFHLPVSNNVYASMGTFAGFKQYRLNVEKVTLDQQGDNAIGTQSDQFGMTPDVSVGLMVYSPKFYIGGSVNQILNGNLNLKNRIERHVSGQAELDPHFYLMGGYRIRLNPEFAFIPSALVRYLPGTTPAADITGKFNYLDLIWMGASYRADDAVVFLVGFSYGNMFDFGYSYDMSANSRNQYRRLNSHEIMIGYRIINRGSGGKPSYVW